MNRVLFEVRLKFTRDVSAGTLLVLINEWLVAKIRTCSMSFSYLFLPLGSNVLLVR